MTPHDLSTIPVVCLDRWTISPVRFLGGRINKHWLVRSRQSDLVLRRCADGDGARIGYELEVLRRLHDIGWPVPRPVEEPLLHEGSRWCLFTMLAGAPLAENGPQERRARGRLLAELHESTSPLASMGQRPGFQLADEVLRDPGLLAAIRSYESLRPAAGHVLRWHLDHALAMLDRIDFKDLRTIVLHSDFAPWNLLYENGQLSGIIDFESTHLNYRVSDFALSWRGYQHEVIEGYEEVRMLTERDRTLLVPAFWSWLFLGVKDEIAHMHSGELPPHDFDWPVKQLLKRSPFHEIELYPGTGG